MAASGVVVKNTFLEVGDHTSLLEKHDGWRRQMSEPVKICRQISPAGEQDTMSELDEEEDEVQQGKQTPELEHGAASMSPVSVQLPNANQHEASAAAAPMPNQASSKGGRGPQVLLLSESIPLRRGGDKEEHRGPGGKKEARKDSHINQMKNNDITRKEPPWTDVTTVMMRNLPNKYTQQMLLEELADSGFRLQADFDFFYLPMDHSNAANLGYCFINFVETAMANAFAAAFQGKKMRRFNSNKTVVVMPASIQGFERNYAYYSSTRVAQAEDPQYRPLFLRPPPDGQAPMSKSQGRGQGGKGRGGGGGMSSMGGQASQPRGKKGAKARNDNSGWGAAANMQDPTAMGLYADWSAMSGAGWPMQPMQPPAPQGGPSPSSGAPQTKICSKCGNECNATHRFCAFCGAFIGPPPRQGGGGGQGRMMDQQGSGMRADAPTFMPGGPSQSPGGSNQQIGRSDASQDGGPSQSLLAGLPYPESVTDELDVMRGRMMLLAALKDMEKRGGNGGAPRVDAGAANDALGESGGLQHAAMRW